MSRREVLIRALSATPADLARIVRAAENTAVSCPSESRHILIGISHFNQAEKQYLIWLRQVIDETRPFIPAPHPKLTAPALAEIDTLLTEFQQARRQTITFLQAQKAGDWQRTAVHETHGVLTFRTLVQMLVDHDTEHLNQIVELRR